MHIRVLIADSDRSLLNSYREFLGRDGFDVSTAADGLECLAKLREWEPDVLVVEVEMPWGGGAGVLDLMHDGAELPQVPVVALASRWSGASVDDALAYCLADSFDFKPITPIQLAGLIRRQIDSPPFYPRENWRRRPRRRVSQHDTSSVPCGETETETKTPFPQPSDARESHERRCL